MPSVNGRYYIMNTKKDTRELFTYDDFAKAPGSTQPFLNYDLFVTTEDGARKPSAGAARLPRGVSRQGRAVTCSTRRRAARRCASITDYVNIEQKNPTDAAIMGQIIDTSGFYDAKTAKQLMTTRRFPRRAWNTR